MGRMLYKMMCSGLISTPLPMRIVARSITFRNSRTFPGQLCCMSTCNAPWLTRGSGMVFGDKGES